jgi:hypothetical protein
LLYQADLHTGYRVAPNQVTQRFGNHIRINEFSMRNDPITPHRPPQTLRVLMLGDSLVNGMVWTDQGQTLTAWLARGLDQQVLPHRPETQVEVLNVAAGSWGPRNELGYLQTWGGFESQVLILVLNTDDFFGGPLRPEVVGRDPNYPDRYPVAALAEVTDQLWRRLPFSKPPAVPPLPPEQDVVGINLKAIADIHHFSQRQGMGFMVVLSPLTRELAVQGGSRNYEKKARQRLQDWVASQGVVYLDLLPLMNDHPQPLTLFSDHIHLSVAGNQWVSQAILREFTRLSL